jgi:rRNA small subunit pseudouridine methyltransferase Nep1
MEKLGIIIAESSLEAITDEMIISAKLSVKSDKYRGSVLDKIVHSRIYKELPTLNKEKRGRPDIVHRSLLAILDSPIFQQTEIIIKVHTIHDLVIDVSSETRLSRSERSFNGLIKQLFDKGRVPPDGKALLKLHKKSLKQLICSDFKNSDKKILFTKSGQFIRGMDLSSIIHSARFPLLIFGGFSHGSIISNLLALEINHHSLFNGSLSTSSTISLALTSLFYGTQ